MNKSKPLIKDTFWRYLTNFWSVVSFVVIILDFKYKHTLSDVMSLVLIVYVSLLAIFVGVKEFERWYSYHASSHPGELFVVGWTILIIGLFVGKIILGKEYTVAGEVVSTYIAVLSIMAITQKSKKMRSTRKRG